MRNIEFKAELRDLDAARVQCRALGADHVFTHHQTDTYYRLPDGRLKRREVAGVATEWIFYHRDDTVRPRASNFAVLTDEEARRRWGTHSLRRWLEVRKSRELWLVENVRIHLDDVEGLGTFIEFEAQVTDRRDDQDCHESVAALREQFGPILGEPISVSYSDLVHARSEPEPDHA